MINVALIDDDVNALDNLSKCFSYLEAIERVDFSIKKFASVNTFLNSYKNQYDIIFLDIEMPEMNGLEAARKIREIDNVVMIVFVTNSARYALQGYEVQALDYIVKPVDKDAFALKMHRVLTKNVTRKRAEVLLKTNEGLEAIRVGDIKYLEIMGHNIVYHTIVGDFEVYGTLSAEEKKLPSIQFAKCNRSCLVNLLYVQAIKTDCLILDNKELPIARPQKKKFIQSMQNYIRGIER